MACSVGKTVCMGPFRSHTRDRSRRILVYHKAASPSSCPKIFRYSPSLARPLSPCFCQLGGKAGANENTYLISSIISFSLWDGIGFYIISWRTNESFNLLSLLHLKNIYSPGIYMLSYGSTVTGHFLDTEYIVLHSSLAFVTQSTFCFPACIISYRLSIRSIRIAQNINYRIWM